LKSDDDCTGNRGWSEGTTNPLINVLIEHYQKSYEVTYKLWRQRNRIFLILLALIAVAALMTVSPAGGHPLRLNYLLEIPGRDRSGRSSKLAAYLSVPVGG
jgi:hypothetical protein